VIDFLVYTGRHTLGGDILQLNSCNGGARIVAPNGAEQSVSVETVAFHTDDVVLVGPSWAFDHDVYIYNPSFHGWKLINEQYLSAAGSGTDREWID